MPANPKPPSSRIDEIDCRIAELLAERTAVLREMHESVVVNPDTAMLRVGFLGATGSYSDLTLTKLFTQRAQLKLHRQGYDSLTQAVDALESGQLDYTLLPIENTIAGSLNETYKMLEERQLSIVDEEVLSVEHCLVGLPGADITQLKTVRSHPVALQQCTNWLSGLSGCSAESRSSTVEGAKSVITENDPSVGAICSETAAADLGLEVLARGIADQAHNYTRFVLVAKEPEAISQDIPARISLILTVNHRRGSLARCLDAFARRGINLTKLESRVKADAPWEYHFYLDIEGHSADPQVIEALGEVTGHANTLKFLGCYPRRSIVAGGQS